jgi:hypothetical protein
VSFHTDRKYLKYPDRKKAVQREMSFGTKETFRAIHKTTKFARRLKLLFLCTEKIGGANAIKPFEV